MQQECVWAQDTCVNQESFPMNSSPNESKARTAILEAYNRLVFNTEGHELRVADIVREADVGRSTFYEHFANADSVFQEAIAVPFRIFASASLEKDYPRLEAMLSHFAEQTIRARTLFMNARIRDQMVNVLAHEYELLLTLDVAFEQERQWCALQLSEANLAMVRQWIDGKLVVDVTRLAQWITKCTEQIQDVVKFSN